MPASTATARRQRMRAAGVRSPWAMFFQGFVKHPVMVGSVVPSSGKLIRRMLGRVDWENTKVFVEYGPGVGTFCRAVLERLSPDAQYIAIDTNIDFVRYLRHDISDPRLTVVHGSAADVATILADHGHEMADYILSGMPFSTLPEGVGPAIMKASRCVLRPGGAMLVYLFHPKVRAFLEPEFPRIDHAVEWWNVPPAQLFWAWKD